MRTASRRLAAILSVSLPLAAATGAHAASRVVVVPVVVGGGAEPQQALMTAMADGLRQNPQWAIEHGDGLAALAKAPPVLTVTDEAQAAFAADVDAAAKQIAGTPADAITTLERVRNELAAAARKGPRGEKADGLAFRASGLLVAALLASKDDERARKLADETTLLFPQRKPGEADQIPTKAAALLASPSPNLGARLALKSRPEGCDVTLGGLALGKSPVEVAVLPGETYYAQARCPVGTQTPNGPSSSPTASPLKKIVVTTTDTTRQEVLDAEFERAFQAEQLRRVRFSSSQERRQLEESYARRLAERFDAEVIVLASVGELSGADWLNARLYLRSGYLNRQGLVRLEAPRANALGRYLATGKEVPGVLRPEEAGALVAASQRGAAPQGQPSVDPWYTDIPGWAFVGVGLTSISLGFWANKVADRKQNEAETPPRPEPERVEQLQREAQNAKFWGGIGTIGGLLMATTGVILLIVPQYNNTQSELFVFSPAPLKGGGGLVMSGRF
jgi:hypothetical protein